MSKAVNSPTARLLQSSRLFSLPRPLPSPDLSSAVSGNYRSSETATTPYPTHQAIATPASSLHRGDWGLKRSLPNKKLRGTNPTVRIRAQDTWEHVTSFESAGDHVRTLQKWGEMGIPMIAKPRDEGGRGPGGFSAPGKSMSVYDEANDITDKATAEARRGEGRWKYDGPWLSGMQEGEFKNWLLRQVSTRQEEWKEFLRQQETERKVRKAWAEARDEGTPLSMEDVQTLRKTSRPNDQELRDIQKRLRDDHAQDRLSSDLTALITTFLDLPAAPSPGQDMGANELFYEKVTSSLTTEKGPPSTHPGAGLSHLRTNAIMENHPIHGPQASRSPVQARVVRPRSSSGMRTEFQAKLGVGGVVAEDTASKTGPGMDRSRYNVDSTDVAHAMNPNIVGGGKVWVQPQSASVDEKGRVMLQLGRGRADGEAVAVKTGEVEAIHEMKRQGAMAPSSSAGGFRGEGANYGTMLPDRRRMAEQGREQQRQGSDAGRRRPRPGVQGFDEELERSSGQGSVADILRRGL